MFRAHGSVRVFGAALALSVGSCLTVELDCPGPGCPHRSPEHRDCVGVDCPCPEQDNDSDAVEQGCQGSLLQ